MRKIYTVITLLFTAVAAMAAKPDDLIRVNNAASGQVEELSRQLTLVEDYSLPVSNAVCAEPKAAPSGEWRSIGTGIYVEGLMSIFNDVEGGVATEVEIEESVAVPGWYRLLPYSDPSCPLAIILGAPDTQNYLYINATDPQKVHVESFTPFGSFEFRSLCPEGGFNMNVYGTLEDGVISFPPQSFGFIRDNSASYANLDGQFKVVLDKNNYKDYTLEVSSELCRMGNQTSAIGMSVNIKTGADIVDLRSILIPGIYSSEGNEEFIMNNGDPGIGEGFNFDVPYAGVYTFMVVGLSSDNKIKARGETIFFALYDAADEWESVGEATYNEGIYSSFFSDVAAESYKVEVERHKTRAGYFRLVDPYATHSMAVESSECNVDHSYHHKHYLYINAQDPEQVYIEPSVIGFKVNDSFGEGYLSSYGYAYVQANRVEDGKNAGVFGTLNGTTISIPDGTMWLGQKKYANGLPQKGIGQNVMIELPANAAIGTVAADSLNDAPVEYFNLQGMRVNNPQSGIYVVRQGDRVSKVMIR